MNRRVRSLYGLLYIVSAALVLGALILGVMAFTKDKDANRWIMLAIAAAALFFSWTTTVTARLYYRGGWRTTVGSVAVVIALATLVFFVRNRHLLPSWWVAFGLILVIVVFGYTGYFLLRQSHHRQEPPAHAEPTDEPEEVAQAVDLNVLAAFEPVADAIRRWMPRVSKNLVSIPRYVYVLIAVVAVGGILIADYVTSLRIVKISTLHDLDARGGEIRISYNRPPSRRIYFPGDDETLQLSRRVAQADKNTEIYTIEAPTPYNRRFTIHSGAFVDRYKLFGLFALPVSHAISTGIEDVRFDRFVPPAKTMPTPDVLDNQIGLRFQGEVRHDFKTGVNILPEDMYYVEMTPAVPGYYRWVDESLLTFNFTEIQPQYETAYTFTFFPGKITDPKYQRWVGKNRVQQLVTGSNEVWVTHFSLSGDDVQWNAPLRIEFSGHMVSPLQVLKQKKQGEIPISIEPNAGGTWRWANSNTIEFRPNDKGWPVRRDVTVKIYPAINQEEGRSWRYGGSPTTYTFHVVPPTQRIQSFNLRGDSVSLEEDLVVKFSRDMVDDEDLRKKIQPNTPAFVAPVVITPTTPGYYYWSDTDRLVYHPSNLWSQLTEYEVWLNPYYNPDPRYEWVGTRGFTFKTVENKVEAQYFFTPEHQLSPSDFFGNRARYQHNVGESVAPEERLWIVFDKKIGLFAKDHIELRNAIKVRPKIKGEFRWLGPKIVEFQPEGHWQEQTKYSVELTPLLLHHPEQHFAEEQGALEFETGEDLVRSNLPSTNQGSRALRDPEDPIEITFAKDLNPRLEVGRKYKLDELESNDVPFRIEPDAPVTVEWKSKRDLIIHPQPYFAPEQEYDLIFSPDILPVQQAEYLEQAYFFKTNKNNVRVASIAPQGRTSRRAVVDIEYNKQIMPKEIAIGDPDQTRIAQLAPRVPGQWVWLSTSKLQFKPERPLDPSTEYKVTIDPNRIQDPQFSWHEPPPKTGLPYPEESYSFHTPILEVVSTNARFVFDENQLLKQKFFLDIELSEPIREDELRKHFSIWYHKTAEGGDETEVPLLYTLEVERDQGDEGVQKFSVVSDWIDRPSRDRRIHYQIREGLMPVVGNRGLQTDYKSDFLQEKAKYLKIERIRWNRLGDTFSGVLVLNAPVEPEKLKSSLAVHELGFNRQKGKAVAFEVAIDSNHTGRGSHAYEIAGGFSPGEDYGFYIREGLLAADGAFSQEDLVSIPSSVPDLPRKLEFGLDGTFLSKKDLVKVPIVTVNEDDFWLKIERVYPNNVRFFINNLLDSRDISEAAKVIHHQQYEVEDVVRTKQIANREWTTHVDLRQILDNTVHGLVRVSVSKSRYRSARSSDQTRWFLATDIGLVTRTFGNQLIVWANSLNDTSALKDVQIRVVDKWNQTIALSNTDAQGVATLNVDPSRQAAHIIATKGRDFSFVDLEKHRQSLTEFEVEGVGNEATTLQSFIYSDRGVYRPGETVHLVGVTRGKEGALPPDYTAKFKLRDPTGKEVVVERFELDKFGVYLRDFEVPAEAKTGNWTASIYWGRSAIGTYKFQVEEFIPNKLEVVASTSKSAVSPGEVLNIEVASNMLFGPPAAGRTVAGKITLRPHYFKPKGYGNFKFGHDDLEFQKIETELSETKLDANGKHTFSYDVPLDVESPIGLKAHYSATVIDHGGRAVSEYGAIDVLPYDQYVGVRPVAQGPYRPDEPIVFQVANVSPAGNPVPREQKSLEMRIYRFKKVTHYRKNERGYYRYVTEKKRLLVENFRGDPLNQQGKLRFIPALPGAYEFEVVDEVGGQTTRFGFRVHSEQPTSPFVSASDRVELDVRQRKVQVNSFVDVDIRTPFDGKMLVTLERDSVLESRIVEVVGGKKSLRFHVPDRYLPNFYVSAMVLRPVAQGDRNNPIVAHGILNVDVSDPAQSPELDVTVPNRVSPNTKMQAKVTVSDTNHDEMFLTVAVVDEGILQLTDYEVPDLTDYFNAKRKLEVEHHHLYSMIMPYEPDIKREISPSGDAPSRALIKKKRVNPTSQARVESVALWSGLVEFSQYGTATVEFDIPDFDGTVRVLAVAFGNQRFASTSEKVLVRDRLVLKPTLPRFIAAGDRFIVPVELFNGTENDASVHVRIQTSDLVDVQGAKTRTLQVPKDREGRASFPVQANDLLGTARIEVVAEGNGEISRKVFNVPQRSPGTLVSFGGSGTVDRDSPKTIDIPDNFKPGSETMALKVSANLLGRFENSLRYLLRYPHGCLEQTTSRLFPLLYFSEMAEAAHVEDLGKYSARHFVREGIDKLELMQLEDGLFSFWPGRESRNEWAHIYAAHFLVSAKMVNYAVDEATWNNMIVRLRHLAKSNAKGGAGRKGSVSIRKSIYASYVLALAGEPVLSTLNYIYENHLDFLEPHSKAQLAAGFSAAGQDNTAKGILGKLSGFQRYTDRYRDTGDTLGSNIRDLAIVLLALVDADPESEHIRPLVQRLAGLASNGRWGTTQENAWAFLAIGRAIEDTEATDTDARITVAGSQTVPFDGEQRLETAQLQKGDVRIEVQGDGEVNYAWQAMGIDADPKSLQVDDGIVVRRRFLDEKGEVLDLANVEQGSLVVAEITIQSEQDQVRNTVVTDLLPMGLEIENPRLASSARMDWVASTVAPDYVDIRDDRINVYLTAYSNERKYSYAMRAVTVGKFQIPQIHAEAMYDPAIEGFADGGELTIVPPAGQ